MRKIKLIIVLCIISASLSSCMSVYYNVAALDKGLDNAVRVVDTLHNREVILLPLPHTGTAKYYDTLRQYIIERRDEGYKFFIEGVAHYDADQDGPFDSLKQDTLSRKLRFVTGFSLGSYNDNENKSLPEHFKHKQRAIDPTVELLGLDGDDGIYGVDLTLGQMVAYFEQRYGKIPLTDYDFQTPLKDSYKKSKDYPYDIFAIASPIREMYVVDVIIRSQFPKLVVMYGLSHLHHLQSKLVAVGYEQIESKYIKAKSGQPSKNRQ